MQNRFKTVLFYVVLWSIFFGILIVGIEICSRLAVYGLGLHLSAVDPAYYSRLSKNDPAYQFEKKFYITHPKFGWALTPNNAGTFRGFSYPKAEFRNRIRINSSGFRSSTDYTVDPGKLRIAVVGDSFVQAMQVEEEKSFLKVVERLLLSAGHNTFVYNFGMSSTGTIHQYQIFKEEVLKVKPQIMILAFFPNDLIDDSPYYWHEDVHLIPQYNAISDNQITLSDFGDKKEGQNMIASYGLKKKIAPSPMLMHVIQALDWASEKLPFLTSLRLLPIILFDKFVPKNEIPAFVDVYKKVYPPALEESVQVTIYFIEQMQQICTERGIDFLVVFIPSIEQVNPSLWNKFIADRSNFLSMDDFDLEHPNKIMSAELQKRHIRYLDLLSVFKKEFAASRFYYKKDMHWNALGHRKAGTILEKYLTSHFLLRQNR